MMSLFFFIIWWICHPPPPQKAFEGLVKYRCNFLVMPSTARSTDEGERERSMPSILNE